MNFRTAARNLSRVVLAWVSLAVGVHAAQPDGPYLLPTAAGDWEAIYSTGEGRRSQPVSAGGKISVPAVGAVPAFQLRMRDTAAVAPDSVTAARKAPIFVVADTHGEYAVLVTLLRAHKVIGAKLEWKYGRGHLVVLGDVFDRGPNHLEILWLLYKLEAEAAAAGGGAHLVLGNHETMVLSGDLRYLHPKYVGTTHSLGVSTYSELFASRTLLGQWLRTRPVMFKIDDLLCLHGGVSRALLESTLSRAEINTVVRHALTGEPGPEATRELVLGSLGPLWYRGYFEGQQGIPASTEDVDLALKAFGVRRILVGHTIVPAVTPLYGGKVIAVQVNPRQELGQPPKFEGLILREGTPWRAILDGRATPLR